MIPYEIPYEELIQFSGNNTSQHYKYNIMKAIKIFKYLNNIKIYYIKKNIILFNE